MKSIKLISEEMECLIQIEAYKKVASLNIPEYQKKFAQMQKNLWAEHFLNLQP